MLLKPVTGKPVALHFKAAHCSKRGNSTQDQHIPSPTSSGLAGSGGAPRQEEPGTLLQVLQSSVLQVGSFLQQMPLMVAVELARRVGIVLVWGFVSLQREL